MAKRAASDEKPYQPVKTALVDAVAFGMGVERREPQPPPREETLPKSKPEPSASAADGKATPFVKRASKQPNKSSATPETGQASAQGRLSREKRVLLTKAEEDELERLVRRVASEGATSIKLSHLLRACIAILRNCEDELVERVRQSGDLVRPPNDNAPALAEFEHRLAQEVALAIRHAPPLR